MKPILWKHTDVVIYKEKTIIMAVKQQLVITLPACLADVPIRIVKNFLGKDMEIQLIPEDEKVEISRDETPKYAFIRDREDFRKVALGDILWIEADGSYSIFHLADGSKQTVSFNLAVIQRQLPGKDFVRIHHSHIVNFTHVRRLMGNCLCIGRHVLPIGREYKREILNCSVILGVHKPKTQ